MGTATYSEFQFTNPLLTNLHFSVNREYKQPSEEGEINIPIQMNVSKPDATECKGRTAFVLLAVSIGDTGADFPYYISVEMGADFRWNESVTDEMAENMLSRNAPALLLGYIRPYIAQITEASPVGAVHVPFMNFNPQPPQK